MTAKIKPFRLYQRIHLNAKQILFIITCSISLLIYMIICISKRHSGLKLSAEHWKLLYVKSTELNLDTDIIESQRQFDIVLSYYSENIDIVAQNIRYLKNISTLKKLNPRIIIYNKNSKISNEILKILLEADVVQLLPNLGREGGTYLYHIINNYHILANHTIFSQAGAEGITNSGLADWFSDRLEQQFNSSVGYMPLVDSSRIVNHDCGSHRTGNFPRMVQMWSILEQSLCPPGGQAVAFCGQFLVSSKRIQDRSLEIYKYIYDLITADSSHWLHRDIRSLFLKSTPDNPIFGHTVERIWTILFQCSKPDLYDRCQRRECACYDKS